MTALVTAKKLLLAGWSVNLSLNAALLGRMIEAKVYKVLPFFFWFIAYEVVRSVALDATNRMLPKQYYGTAWAITEPIDIALMALAGLENFSVMIRARTSVHLYMGILLALAIIGFTFPLVNLTQTHERDFIVRALVDFVIAAGLLVTMLLERRPSLPTSLLIAYFAIDLISYVALVLDASTDWRPQAFVMIGQTALVLCWCLYIRRIVNWAGDARRLTI